MGHFRAKSSLLAATLAMGLGTSACLNRSLPVLPTQKEDEAPLVSVQDQSPAPSAAERERYIDELGRKLTTDSAGDSALDELIRLLREMNQNPAAHALSMKELRTIQELVLSSDLSLVESLRPHVAPSASTGSGAEGFDLSYPARCPSPTYEVKTLPSGLRVISGLPRQDACSLKLSRVYQDLLNRILKSGEAEFSYAGQTHVARSLPDFFKQIERLGFSVQVHYRSYLAPFVHLYQPQGDPYLAETEIPLPLWLKPGILTRDGAEVVLPAPHSEVFFRVSASEREPEAQFKIYFSDKGFVFDDEDLVLPHWAGERRLDEIPPDKLPHLLSLIRQLHQTFEIFKARAPKSLPAGGFGLLGVCNDGSALLMKGLIGAGFVAPFPMVRTDRISMPEEDYPLKALWESTPSDTSERQRLTREEMIARVKRGNPFVDMENPFPVFREILESLDSEKRSE